MRADAQRNYASLLSAARVAVSERGADIVLEDIAKSAGVAIGTLYRHFPTRQDLLEAVFLDETRELRGHAESLASAPVPFDALISWLRLQMNFAARGRSMGAAIMAAKHVPGTRIFTANKAMHEAGEVLLLRAQAAEQIRTDVHILDVIRLVYGIALVNEHASDLMGPTACSISSSPESEQSRAGTKRWCVTSRREVDPTFRRRAPGRVAHRLRWKRESQYSGCFLHRRKQHVI